MGDALCAPIIKLVPEGGIDPPAGFMLFPGTDLGVEEVDEGYHDEYWITAQMVTDPSTVRYKERVQAGKASINGVSIAPAEETIAIGNLLLQRRIDQTEKGIRLAVGDR